MPFAFFAAILLAVFAHDTFFFGKAADVLSRKEALILLVFFVLFLGYSFYISKTPADLCEEIPAKKYRFPVAVVLVLIGLCALTFGGKWIVNGAVELAHQFNVSDSLIGLTIIAVGTCLPELATAVVAAVKKNPDLAIGGIVGSNIFNIFFVLGISGLVNPLTMQATSSIDMLVMIAANILLFIAMFTGGKRLIDRWEGWLFLATYCGYIVFLIIQG
jgi:cation:H+ antiporter